MAQGSTLRLVKEVPLQQIAADAVAEYRRTHAPDFVTADGIEGVRILVARHGAEAVARWLRYVAAGEGQAI